MKTLIILVSLALTMVLAHPQARATCSGDCTIKLVDDSCDEVKDAWPADLQVTVAASCSEYCSYIDPSTNQRNSYTQVYDADRLASTLTMFHGEAPFTDLHGDAGIVKGAFKPTGEKCGDQHVLRFDSTLDEGTKYWVKAYYSAVGFTASESQSGCSVGRGESGTAAGLSLALVLVGLAVVSWRRRRRSQV